MLRVLVLLSFLSTLALARLVQDGKSSCSENQFQCQNGTCIPLGDKCDYDTLDCARSTESRARRDAAMSLSEGTCVLPPYPDQGTYKVFNVNDAKPGQSYDSIRLTVSCHQGFEIVASDGDVISTGKQEIYCISGVWTQGMPKCVHGAT